MLELMFYTDATDKAGKGWSMEERITSDKNECCVVKSGRAQNNGSAPVERGLLMHGNELDLELLSQFGLLSTSNKESVIAALLIFLSAQEGVVSDRQSVPVQNQ